MGLNCQLCPEDRRARGTSNAHAPALRRAARRRHASLLALLLAAACGEGSGDAEPDTGTTTDADSGDTSTGTDTTDPTTSPTSSTEPTTTTDPTATSDEPGDSDGGGAEEVGPNFGLLTFTLYPADAGGSPEQLGMAGAWRTEPFTTDDFYGVHALGLHFPLAPAAADTLEQHDPQVYEWGKAETWVALGNGVRLTPVGVDDGDALACLELVADSYPVYFSGDAPIFDPSCAPDPARWLPTTQYDLIVYGGEDFSDQLRTAAVITPAPLTVTAPAIDVFDFPLGKAEDLALAWQADGAAGDRVVIRVWDQFGEQIVVHAADDGSYTIAGAELDKLSAGPATLTLAREHVSEVGLAAGVLRVVTRHEVTAYPDLF